MSQVIRKHGEFRYIMNGGHKTVSHCFVAYKIAKNALPFADKYSDKAPLYGIMATKKIGNAVERNFAKRRMRHIIRMHDMDCNFCYIFVVRRTILTSLFEDIKEEMRRFL